MAREDKKNVVSEEIVLTDSGSSIELFSNPGKVRVVLVEEKDKNGSVSLKKFVTLDFKKVDGKNVGVLSIKRDTLKTLLSNENGEFAIAYKEGNVSEKIEDIEKRFMPSPFLLSKA
jgi:hypothetical protein